MAAAPPPVAEAHWRAAVEARRQALTVPPFRPALAMLPLDLRAPRAAAPAGISARSKRLRALQCRPTIRQRPDKLFAAVPCCWTPFEGVGRPVRRAPLWASAAARRSAAAPRRATLFG